MTNERKELADALAVDSVLEVREVVINDGPSLVRFGVGPLRLDVPVSPRQARLAAQAMDAGLRVTVVVRLAR